MVVYVLDSGAFIKKQFYSGKVYTTESVMNEIKDSGTREFISCQYINLIIQNPTSESVKIVTDLIKPINSNLSITDIEIVALTYELFNLYCGGWIDSENINNMQSVKCITYDNGIRGVLETLGLSEQFETQKYFKYRCFACYSIYESQIDFCKSCGHKTVTRVAFIKEGDKEIICLKKNYKFKEKNIKDSNGNIIYCEDTSAYNKYQKYIRRINK